MLKFFLRWFYTGSSRRNSLWGCRISKRYPTVVFFSPSNQCSRKEWLYKNNYFFWHRTRASQRIFYTSSVKYLQ